MDIDSRLSCYVIDVYYKAKQELVGVKKRIMRSFILS